MNDLYSVETIGCDKLSLRGFGVKKIDFPKMERKENVRVDYRGGKEVQRITISDNKMFHTLVIERRQEEGVIKEETNLSICLGEVEGNNMFLWSVARYKRHLLDLCIYCQETYGIDVDFRNVRISTIEVGCNCALETDFADYQRAFQFIFNILPKALRLQMSAKKDEGIESFMARNSQREFTVYDKNQEMIDKNEDAPEINVARIEYRLRTGKKVKEAFGTDMLADVTDNMVQSYFISTFRKEVEKAYKKWYKENNLFLKNMVQEYCRKSPRTWQVDLLLECKNSEQIGEGIILLDIEDLLHVLQELDEHGNYKRVSKAILKKMRPEDGFQKESGKKIEEVVERVELIYQKGKSQ